MTDDDGTMESLLSGAGIMVAAALAMLAVISLARSTGTGDAAVELQTAAADVCGDIGTVAASAVPCSRNITGPRQSISLRIMSDYVVAVGPQGMEFARPLAMRIFPGNYRGADGAGWNGTAGLREYLNATFGRPGTRESPLSNDNGSSAIALLEKASLDMGIHPVHVEPSMPLIIEKMLLYIDTVPGGRSEGVPYVFIYPR